MFFNLLLKSSAFSFLIVLLCFFCRIAFVLYLGVGHDALYSDGANTQKLSHQIVQFFYNGFLYDTRVIAVATILYFLCGLIDLCINKIRHKENLSIAKGCAYALFALLLFLNIANMTYYTIYKDVFNIILLGIFFDDQQAIFEDGISGKYFLSVKFLCFFIALACWIWLYKRFVEKVSYKLPVYSLQTALKNVFAFVCFSLGITFLFNSSFSLKEVSLDQEVKPVKNAFLQKITPSALRSLYGVYEGYKAGETSSFASFVDRSPYQSAIAFFGITPPPSEKLDLKLLLQQKSNKNPKSPKINHIFYIVAESLGTYAFDEKYDAIGLVSGMKSLIDHKKGFLVPYFFENAHGTIWSIETQISGLYYTGVRLSFQSARLKELPTAVASNMKRVGFETNFYYGGSEGWQNLGNYAKSQGFERVYGTSVLEDFALKEKYPSPYRNVWGVWDSILLDYVAYNNAQSSKPSFHMILTTSFHGPMNLPWEYIQKAGGKKEDFERFSQKISSPKWEALELATLWWVDKQITHFIKTVSAQYPDSLFVVTGDHTHYAYTDGVLSYREVPMLIYSPSMDIYPLTDSGSQLDILPTLLNLASQKGFEFYSFGRPIFGTSKDEKLSNPFFGAFEIMGDGEYVYMENFRKVRLKDYQVEDLQQVDKQMKKMIDRLREGRGLSWYLFSEGESISRD